jgi:hypothetical protein
MGIVSKLDFFTTNNATTNDVVIDLILQRLRPNITYRKERRVRCLDHIINLAAKAFLFGGDQECFEDIEISYSQPITTLEAEIAFWRNKGVLGKLHNLIVFIRKTPQRREKFFDQYKAAKVIDIEFEGKILCKHLIGKV